MSNSIGISEIEKKSLGNLLSRKTFQVPHFQRSYSWTKDNWMDFISDLQNLMDFDRAHFFGFVTFKKISKSNYQVIEGQQRLTTVTIFLCVIRDLCTELDFNTLGEKIHNKYIEEVPDFGPKKKGTPKPNLVLSKINKDFFRKNIQLNTTYPKKINAIKTLQIHPSNKLLFNCYKYFYSEMSNAISGLQLTEKEEKLDSYVYYLTENFILIYTEAEDSITAYNIFQTINDRGLDLTLSDILKVHLCEKVKEEKEFIEEYWDDIRCNLLSGSMNNFLRHYWLSSKGVVKITKLLVEIKNHIKDEDTAFSFIEV